MSVNHVLARKWRPKTFTELVGQEHVVKALTNALSQQRLHHAYLFTGTRGVGKTTLARILAKALNCETGITPVPCGQCPACREIDSGRFIDLLELDAASNTGIDNMREVLDNAQYAPTRGRFKIYIIDEVHMLSTKAFNSMLKTLEEPPEHVKFILATTDPQKIPVTVLSRCLQFNLKRIPFMVITGYLQQVLEKEKISGESSALQLLARAAQGSMRDALSLLDQAIAHDAGKVTESGVREMLGAIDQTYLFEILRALLKRDGVALIEQVDQMTSRSLSLEAALQDLATLLQRIALAQTVPEAVGMDMQDRTQILELARAFNPEDVQLFYDIALRGRNEIDLAPDEQAGFSMTLLRMLAFMPADSPAASADEKKFAMPMPQQASLPEVGGGSASVNTAVDNKLKKNSFDGDWSVLVSQLKLGGMAKMLAQHCELAGYGNDVLELRVPEPHKHLLEKSYQEKLKLALNDYFGKHMAVSLAVGSSSGNTPAEKEHREKQDRQMRAIEAIEKDPFVRELVENFDAKVIDSSIKPVQ
ncbi:MAG TPA: DNA polymerase III subunit gamma/tau [Burkholderiales bacterium]|nr:DNA polymerase III subunit gamma/tau [Burkholderiales bacterium]